MKKFLQSFVYAFQGVKTAFAREQNMKIHVLATILIIGAGFLFCISTIEWIIIILCISSVIALEIMNTAIEATVDLISPEKHPLAKIAKDCAAGAVLVMSIASVVIAVFIFFDDIKMLLA
ncbi:MAG: diacylglycerol kinase family protein [Chitinophagales bacterium]